MEILTIYPPGGPEALAFAAAELKDYLGRMLAGEEGRWTVELVLEPSPPEENDRFSLSVTPEGGRLAANRGRAALLGAYHLLRRLGCRFLAPGRGNEIVPAVSRAGLKLEETVTASFRHRGVCIEGADSRENVLDFIDWLPKAGFNSFFFQFKIPYTFYARWYHHEGNPLLPPEPFSVADAAALCEEAERELRRRGLLLHKVGHGWTGEALGCETVAWKPGGKPLPRALAQRAALVNGRRELFMGIPADTNLCYHNGEAVEAFTGLVADYAAAHPDVDYLHIWLADEYNNVCECEECRKTTLSDQYVELLDGIDRRLTERGLDTKLVFLLYQELLWPPVRARLKNPDRFVLMFAPISRTFERSYDLGAAEAAIPPYERNRITLPVDLAENLAFLRGWQGQFRGDSFVYDYPLGRAHYGDFGYVGLSRVIAGDIKRLRQMGLNGYMSCQELRAAMPNALPNYVMGRMLMDETADVEEIMTEYFSAAYGPGWEGARDCLSRLSELSGPDYLNGKGPRRDPAMAQRFERLEALCVRFHGELERRAPAEDAVREGFWARLERHLEASALLARAMAALARGEEDRARGLWEDLRDLVCQREAALQPWLDVYRLLEVTEKYTGLGPLKQ